MFLSGDVAFPYGPPPDSVLRQRPLWFALVILLIAALCLRVVVCDIVGGLLCVLLLALCGISVQDGMQQTPRLCLLFGLLCTINFVLYFPPMLVGVLGGRMERHVVPVSQTRLPGGSHRLSYTVTVQSFPFFDRQKGLLYNVQSVGMVVMPVSMLLGAYLGIAAQQAIASQSAPLSLEEAPELGLAGEPGGAAGRTLIQERRAAPRDASVAGYGAMAGQAQPFQGTAHKLAI